MAVGGHAGRPAPNRGKSLGTVIEQQYRYKDNEKWAGAIKKEKHVLAIDRKLKWKLAQILEVRYEVPYADESEFWDIADATDATAAENQFDEPISSKQPFEESKTVNGAAHEGGATVDAVCNGTTAKNPEDANEAAIEAKAKQPVEYYVHYLEEERLMDRWVKENMVQINDDLVENLLDDFQRRDEAKKRQ